MKGQFVFWLFSVLGILMLVGEGFYVKNEYSFVQRAKQTQGTVLELVRHVSSGSKRSVTYAPRVKFVLPDGTVHEFTSEMSSSNPGYAVGQPVKVLYDPAKPEEAEIDSWLAIWGGPAILGLLGVVFTAVGVGSLLSGWRRKRYCAQLLQSGIKITATGGTVERDCSVRVNRQCAWRLVCEAEYNGERRVFRSDRLWKDPTEFVRDKQVTIAIDPANPQKYCVDTSFMP